MDSLLWGSIGDDVFLLLISLSAHAADVTYIPDAMTGAVELRYRGSIETASLEELDQSIARRTQRQHTIRWGASFSPIRGLSAAIRFEQTPLIAYQFRNAQQMVIDPLDGGGTYLPGDIAPDSEIRGNGLNGVWFGMSGVPFSEAYALKDPITWKVDLSFRTGNRNNSLWTVNEGDRGAALGGGAMRLTTSFSSRRGRGDSYLRLRYHKEFKATVEQPTVSGGVTEVEIRPASQVSALAGVEIIGHDTATSVFAVDLHLGTAYHTWEDITTGVYLPNTLDTALGIPVTSGEYVQAQMGLGFRVRILDNVRFSLDADGLYNTPHRLEHVYTVRTAEDNVGIRWTVGLTGLLGAADFGASSSVEGVIQPSDNSTP